jgi:hypothetical protein
MLADDVVLVRTEKGDAELVPASSPLDPAARTLLFLLDGKANVGTILRRAQDVGQPRRRLLELFHAGYADAVAVPALDLGNLRREAIALLHQLLGPDADALSLELERAGDQRSIAALLQRCHAVVAAVAGPRQAVRFREKTLARLMRV